MQRNKARYRKLRQRIQILDRKGDQVRNRHKRLFHLKPLDWMRMADQQFLLEHPEPAFNEHLLDALVYGQKLWRLGDLIP